MRWVRNVGHRKFHSFYFLGIRDYVLLVSNVCFPVEYVSGVLPAPKSVVSHVESILSPASDLLSPAAKSVGDLLAELAGRTGNATAESTAASAAPGRSRPKSAIRAAATAAASAASNRAIRMAVDAARTILAIAFEPLMMAHLSLVLDEPQLQYVGLSSN